MDLPSRILGPDGRPALPLADARPVGPFAESNGKAGGGDFDLPHVLTFAALLNSTYRVYYSGRWDEAMRHSRQDAVVMENDCFLMGLLQERTRAVTSLPWHLEIDDEENPVQTLVRDHLTQALRRTPRFRYLLKWLYSDGTWKGRTAAQLKYRWCEMPDPNGMPVKTLCVEKWLPVSGDKINHTWEHVPTIQIHSSSADEIPGAEFLYDNIGRALIVKGSWKDHFQFYYNDPQDTDFFDGIFSAEAVHGRGVRSVVFWWNWIRLERLSQVSDYLERVGMGVTVWYYELGNAASETAVAKAAKEQSGKVNVILPRTPTNKGQGLERIETPVSGAEAVSRIAETIEWYIERYIIGQKMSAGTDSKGSLGGTGRAEFAADTKGDITEEGANNLAESLTGSDTEFGLLRHLHKHTFPQYAPGTPQGFEVRFKLGVKDPKAKERLEAIKTVVDLGVDVRADDAREAAGLAKPKEGDELCQGQQQGMGPDGEPGAGIPPPGGGGKGPRKGDWNPFHGPRGGLWERNRQSGTVRHPRHLGGGKLPSRSGGPHRFRMGGDGRPEWIGPERHAAPRNSFDPGGWITVGGHAGPHGEHHAGGHPIPVGTAQTGAPPAQAAPDQSGPGQPTSDLDETTQALGMGPAVQEVSARQQGARNAADVRQANRAELKRMSGEWEARANQMGFMRSDLRSVVEDMRKQDRERVQQHNVALTHARQMLKHYGVDPRALVRGLRSNKIEDAAQVKAMDAVSRSVAKQYPDLFPGLIAGLDDPDDTTDLGGPLLDMLHEGSMKPMAEEELHEDALSYLEEMAASNTRAIEERQDAEAEETPLEEEGDPSFEFGEPATAGTTADPVPAAAKVGVMPHVVEKAREYLNSLGTPPPPPKAGMTRLYRGSVKGKVAHENSFWADERGLAGVVIPFAKDEARELIYVDVPDHIAQEAIQRGGGSGGATAGEAIGLPEEYRRQAKRWGSTPPAPTTTPEPPSPAQPQRTVRPPTAGATPAPESGAAEAPTATPSDLDPGPYKVFTWELERLLTKGLPPQEAARQAKAAIEKHLPQAEPTGAPQRPAARRPGEQGHVGGPGMPPLVPAIAAGPTPKHPGSQQGQVGGMVPLAPSHRALIEEAYAKFQKRGYPQPGSQFEIDEPVDAPASTADSPRSPVQFQRRFSLRDAFGMVLRLVARGRPDRYAFDPNQPRVPAGSAEGGEWTAGHRAAHAVKTEGGEHNFADVRNVRKRLTESHGIGDFAAQEAAIMDARKAGLVTGSALEGRGGENPERAAENQALRAAAHRGAGDEFVHLSLRDAGKAALAKMGQPPVVAKADAMLGEQQAQTHLDSLIDHAAQNAYGMEPGEKRAFSDMAKGALAKMPSAFKDAVAKSAVSMLFGKPGSLPGFRQALYMPKEKQLMVNGPARIAEGPFVHEAAHAVDATLGISKSKEWQEAWQKEIVDPGVLATGPRKDPAEGFAELCRGALLEWTPEVFRRTYPKCAAIFDRYGLAPAPPTGHGRLPATAASAESHPIHEHIGAGDHGKALDLFSQMPEEEAKAFIRQAPAGTVKGLFDALPAQEKPAGKPIDRGDQQLRDLAAVQKRGPHWDMPQPGAMGTHQIEHLPSGQRIHGSALGSEYHVKDKAGKKLAGPFKTAEEAAGHVEGGA